MKDYNINFQEVIDAFTIKELAYFSIKVREELEKRLNERRIHLHKEMDTLNNVENKINNLKIK